MNKSKKTKNSTNSQESAIPHKREINWQTYPYNSSDCSTLKNRANKVRERVKECTTLHELNQLLFSNKATEAELNWLVENYLSKTEIEQLNRISRSTQGNLFENVSI